MHRRHRLGHRPQLHRLRPARRRRDDAHVRGRPDLSRTPAASGRSSRSTASTSSTPRRPPSARSCATARAGRSATTCRACGCSAPSASRSTPRSWMWYRDTIGRERAARSSTRTGRRRPAASSSRRSRAPRRSSRARATVPFFGVEPKVVREDGTRGRPGRGRLPRRRQAVAGHAARHVGRPGAEAACARSTSSASRARYFTGDGARVDEDGYFWLLGRVDDVINVSGHRLGTAEIESALVSHEAVSRGGGRRLPAPGQGRGHPRVRRAAATSQVPSRGPREDPLRPRAQDHRADRASRTTSSSRATCRRRAVGKIMRRILRKIAAGRDGHGGVRRPVDAGRPEGREGPRQWGRTLLTQLSAPRDGRLRAAVARVRLRERTLTALSRCPHALGR